MPHASHTPAECDVAKLIQSDSRLLLVFVRWSDWVGLWVGLLILLSGQRCCWVLNVEVRQFDIVLIKNCFAKMVIFVLHFENRNLEL